MRIFASILAISVLIATNFLPLAQAFQEKADGSPRVVLVLEDAATLGWEKSTVSRYDGLPILGPATPDKRQREARAMVQEALNKAGPSAAVWDYYFQSPSAPQSQGTQQLIEAFGHAGFPLVIGVGEGDDHDGRFYSPGQNRLYGSISYFLDLNQRMFSPVGIPQCWGTDIQNTLAITSAAAWLMSSMSMNQKEALQIAWRRAITLMTTANVAYFKGQWDMGSCGEHLDALIMRGIAVNSSDMATVEVISMKDIGTQKPEAMAKLMSALVFLGGVDGDSGDIFGDGRNFPKVWVHLLAAKRILSR